MLITEDQKRLIIEIGTNFIGLTDLELNCSSFVKRIYAMADIDINFCDCPQLSLCEITENYAIGHPIFLHRKNTKLHKKITHMGIIFPGNNILHYSRRITGEFSIYKVFLSSFEDVFKIYDFVEF